MDCNMSGQFSYINIAIKLCEVMCNIHFAVYTCNCIWQRNVLEIHLNFDISAILKNETMETLNKHKYIHMHTNFTYYDHLIVHNLLS